MDYLETAKEFIEQGCANQDTENAQVDIQLATACALVARTELLATQVGLLAALIDMLIVPGIGDDVALAIMQTQL